MEKTLLLDLATVSFAYGRNKVVNSVSLQIPPGRIVALLGPNGAGKSTLNRMIRGEIEPTQGHIRFPFGNHSIGVLQQETAFPRLLTALEVLELTASHFPGPTAFQEVTSQLGLLPLLKRRLSQLSGGQARLVALAQAFLGRPKLVLLDEPTTGLDIESRQRVWDYLRAFRNQGGSILLATHDMNEADELCDDVLMIDQGELRFSGEIDSFRSLIGGRWVQFRSEAYRPLPGYDVEMDGQGHYRALIQDSDQFVRELIGSNIPFQQLTIENLNLGSVFKLLMNNAQKKGQPCEA